MSVPPDSRTADAESDTRLSPLDAVHAAAGASFTEFGGWRMPVRYGSELAEHHAVRSAVGLFDISHMAEFAVTGPGSAAFLDFAFAGVISAVPPGRAKYSLLLAEDGGIIDDVIVYARDPGRYLVVANAGNHDPVWEQLQVRASGFAVDLVDQTFDLAMLAIQGPRALETVRAIDGLTPAASAAGRPAPADFGELKYYASADGRFGQSPVIVARTGYTGEDGFEIYVPVADAALLWRAVVEAGTPLGLTLCGLACRDTLRLEAGMPLYGHELTRETLPAQAGLGRVVAPVGSVYVGMEGIARSQRTGAIATRVLVGLRGEGRRAARAGYPIVSSDDAHARVVGEVTSGALSPTLEVPIALAYVDTEVAAPGTVVFADVRGKRLAMTVVETPFYRRSGR